MKIKKSQLKLLILEIVKQVKLLENTINFDLGKYKKFKKAYNDAVKANQDTFNFDGQEVLTKYAKYVLQYLEPKFGGIKEIVLEVYEGELPPIIPSRKQPPIIGKPSIIRPPRKKLTRRDWIKRAALGTVGVAAAGYGLSKLSSTPNYVYYAPDSVPQSVQQLIRNKWEKDYGNKITTMEIEGPMELHPTYYMTQMDTSDQQIIVGVNTDEDGQKILSWDIIQQK
jgi:hypothetical protein